MGSYSSFRIVNLKAVSVALLTVIACARRVCASHADATRATCPCTYGGRY